MIWRLLIIYFSSTGSLVISGMVVATVFIEKQFIIVCICLGGIMEVSLLKAGFIIIATAGFVLINIGSRIKAGRMIKAVTAGKLTKSDQESN